MTNIVMTRQQYMDGNAEIYASGVRDEAIATARHRAYYSQFVSEGIKQRVAEYIGLDAIKQSKDPHFNDIPLSKWDVVASYGLGGAAVKMKKAGDYLTKAGAVCIVKEAAQQLKEAMQ